MGGVSSAAAGVLRLPKRQLPVIPQDAAFCLTDGPSCDEYDLTPIWDSGCTTVGYNRAWQQGRIDHYVAFHGPCIQDFLDNSDYPATVHALPQYRTLFDMHAKPGLHEFRVSNSALPVCTAYSIGCRKIFVLGEDGYYTTRGRHRGQRHSAKLHYEGHIAVYAPQEFRAADLKNPVDYYATMNRVGVAWNSQRTYHDALIFTLSPFSWPRLVYPIPGEILQQPFGNIDRTGEAVVIEIGPYTENDQVDAVHYHDCFAAADWLKHANAVKRLRAMQPNIAIFVRSAWCVGALTKELAGYDIVVGSLEDQVDPAGFSNIFTMRLPPIAT